MTWHQLGPREKQTLAILRLREEPLTTREVLNSLQADGADLAYTTVSTVLDRVTGKAVMARTAEIHAGFHRYRDAFDATASTRRFASTVVELVPGNHRLDRHAVRATEEHQ